MIYVKKGQKNGKYLCPVIDESCPEIYFTARSQMVIYTQIRGTPETEHTGTGGP